MDEQRFDNWTRTLATLQSRRQTAGALLGGLLAGFVFGEESGTDARKRKKGRGNSQRHRHQERERSGQSNRATRGDDAVEAQKGGKGQNHKKHKKKNKGGANKPNPKKCHLNLDCSACESCNKRKCVKTRERDGEGCGECKTCLRGNCLPDPALQGKPCKAGTCRACNANGECGGPSNALCTDGKVCRPQDGKCVVACLDNGAPCPPNHICIDDGILGAPNECCLVRQDAGQEPTNFGCGDNGDGTFSKCCSAKNERCCDDIVGPRCIPKDECCANETACGGTCCGANQKCRDGQCVTECPGGRPACNGKCCAEEETCCFGECSKNVKICESRTGPFCVPDTNECCGDTFCNGEEDCCDPEIDLCCEAGRCAGKECCPTSQVICGAKCCKLGYVCCGGECCPSFDCLNNSCCAEGVCGDLTSSHRICPAPEETCCSNVGGSAFACPPGNPVCGANGKCCPEFTLFRENCGGVCCPGLSCNNCVPASSGRT